MVVQKTKNTNGNRRIVCVKIQCLYYYILGLCVGHRGLKEVFYRNQLRAGANVNIRKKF